MRFSKDETIHVILDPRADAGIRRIWEKVADDIKSATGADCVFGAPEEACEQAIVVSTAKDGALFGALAERVPELFSLAGKWEAYGFYFTERPISGAERGLIIMGSDKLGTIYGMFRLSELLGVTAWSFWGDAEPPACREVVLTEKENRMSGEPSVKYRGFFINDEWPCFGTWTTEHYGGFTAQMYERVFEYLLRMKGNYLWPAMWSSSFLLDGPGLASMELATQYGIYIGMSHHEPCMRSGEEFILQKGEGSPYGTEWDYAKNREGLLKFWEDGLTRVKGQNIFPTVGMRGERDSRLLEEGSTVEENVRQLKEIITQQRRLIRECVEAESGTVPQLFAVYKEVEEYFFGGGQSEGLRGFSELDDVTLLFCDDNFGTMRALPQTEHRGGYGMYYHLDYHGEPVSYEWVNSTPVTRIWEQMTQAYEYGVRSLWIVNAGDVKFQEYPLGFFMELAYDFKSLGTGCYPQALAYPVSWIRRLFGKHLPEEMCREIAWILEESVRLHGLRRAESCNDRVYHPAHYHEGERMLRAVQRLEQKNERMLERLAGTPCADTYFSMIYYPAAGIANLLKMHLYAGFNHLYAAQGLALANVYGEKLQGCIERDAQLGKRLAAFRDGKWRGMERAAHIGFTSWNMQDWRYPVRHTVTLPEEARLCVSRTDDVRTYTDQYFPVPLVIEDFLRTDAREVTLRVANGGQGTLQWRIADAPGCLEFSPDRGSTGLAQEVQVRVRRENIPEGEKREIVCFVKTEQESVPLRFWIQNRKPPEEAEGMALLQDGVCALAAADFCRKTPGRMQGREASFEVLEDYGKFGSGVKVFPVTASFEEGADAPCLFYELWSPAACAASLELHTSPANPLVYGGMLRMGVSVNGGPWQEAVLADCAYRGGEPLCRKWAEAVLNQEHVARLPVSLRAGRNQIAVSAREAGVVLERLVICQEGKDLKPSYFGPCASHRGAVQDQERRSDFL